MSKIARVVKMTMVRRDKKEEEINIFDHSANSVENSSQLGFCQTVAADSEAPS